MACCSSYYLPQEWRPSPNAIRTFPLHGTCDRWIFLEWHMDIKPSVLELWLEIVAAVYFWNASAVGWQTLDTVCLPLDVSQLMMALLTVAWKNVPQWTLILLVVQELALKNYSPQFTCSSFAPVSQKWNETYSAIWSPRKHLPAKSFRT